MNARWVIAHDISRQYIRAIYIPAIYLHDVYPHDISYLLDSAIRGLIANTKLVYKNGLTPLHTAAASGYVETVKLLLDSRVEIEGPDAQGNTPLHLAAERGRTEIVKMFLQLHPKFATKNDDGDTVLHLACRSESESRELFKLFLDVCLELGIMQNNRKSTVWHNAEQSQIDRIAHGSLSGKTGRGQVFAGGTA
jgi:ankyrin repeat protein